jgi:hypothetical protein
MAINWGAFNPLDDEFDPIGGARDALGLGVPQNPGGSVGAAQPDKAWALQDVPGTNFQYNPATGQYYQKSYTDANGNVHDLQGTQVAAAPNLAQQASGSTVLQQLYLQQQQEAQQRAAQTRAGQTQLAGNFQQVVDGRAPSVAATQLTTGLGRIAADQTAMAAGAGGQNAFAARRAAANNTARAQSDLSGQQALVRAAESAAGRSGLSQLYGSMAGADQAATQTATGAGLGYGSLAEQAEADRIGANQAAAATNAKGSAAILGGAASLFLPTPGAK